MPIRLLVADQSAACLSRIQALLQTAPEFAVVATTRDGEAAVQLALSLQPDVLLLETDLPSVNGIAVMSRVHRADPRIRGVFFTEREGERWEQLGLEAGAAAWVNKKVDDAMLLRVLRDVAAGRRPPGGAATRLDIPPAERHHGVPLTQRESDVLHHAALGLTSKEIAALLGWKPSTVDAHLERLRHKFARVPPPRSAPPPAPPA